MFYAARAAGRIADHSPARTAKRSTIAGTGCQRQCRRRQSLPFSATKHSHGTFRASASRNCHGIIGTNGPAMGVCATRSYYVLAETRKHHEKAKHSKPIPNGFRRSPAFAAARTARDVPVLKRLVTGRGRVTTTIDSACRIIRRGNRSKRGDGGFPKRATVTCA